MTGIKILGVAVCLHSVFHICVCMFTFGMCITQGRCPHVTQADCSFTAAVDEQVTVLRVTLGCCYHLSQVLHVHWLNVHDVLFKSKGSKIILNSMLINDVNLTEHTLAHTHAYTRGY